MAHLLLVPLLLFLSPSCSFPFPTGSITTLNESLRTHQHQYHDLLEKSQIFYRRLVAVGETSGLEPLDGDDDNVLVGSLARTIARSQRTLGSSVINQDMDGQFDAARAH